MGEKLEKQKKMQQWDMSSCTVISTNYHLKVVELIYSGLAEVLFILVQSTHVLLQVSLDHDARSVVLNETDCF